MKTIPLTQGYEALVDDADYEWLSRIEWSATVQNRTVYVSSSCGTGKVISHAPSGYGNVQASEAVGCRSH